MERIRKPFQGVTNIIRFNWHFYVIAIVSILILNIIDLIFYSPYPYLLFVLSLLIFLTLSISLLVSCYVYDGSDLYQLNWLDRISIPTDGKFVNVHAGFDETSLLLQAKFPNASLQVFDFYDPVKHTEVSIRRARKAYPVPVKTESINTSHIPMGNEEADGIFVTLAAHEIRNKNERDLFFKELHRILKPSGKILVTEHLRNLPNFLAYNIGFFHFMPKSSWLSTFENSRLGISDSIKITPFISVFILEKYGTST